MFIVHTTLSGDYLRGLTTKPNNVSTLIVYAPSLRDLMTGENQNPSFASPYVADNEQYSKLNNLTSLRLRLSTYTALSIVDYFRAFVDGNLQVVESVFATVQGAFGIEADPWMVKTCQSLIDNFLTQDTLKWKRTYDIVTDQLDDFSEYLNKKNKRANKKSATAKKAAKDQDEEEYEENEENGDRVLNRKKDRLKEGVKEALCEMYVGRQILWNKTITLPYEVHYSSFPAWETMQYSHTVGWIEKELNDAYAETEEVESRSELPGGFTADELESRFKAWLDATMYEFYRVKEFLQ